MKFIMKETLKISTFQMDIEWENAEKNWNNVLNFSKNLKTDVLILPEMFLSGFSIEPERVAILEDDTFLAKIKKLSKKLDAAICGSLVVNEGGNYLNRMYFIHPDGKVDQYDKRHLFRMAGEDRRYTAGDRKVIVSFRGFKFCLQVCYDLRFPVWSRNSSQLDTMYDCLIYVANWPKVRSDAWYCLLKARAIENWCYCVGVNRVGTDGNGLEYDGKSAVVDFKGCELSSHVDDLQSIETTLISKFDLIQYREVFPAYLDAEDGIKSAF
jgi:predicted amidohydrolase